MKDPQPHGRATRGARKGKGRSLEAGREQATERPDTRHRTCRSAVGRGQARGGVGWCKASATLSLQAAWYGRHVKCGQCGSKVRTEMGGIVNSRDRGSEGGSVTAVD